MRLPQSFNRYLSAFSFTVHYSIIGVMLVLFGLVPASAFAATPQLVSSPRVFDLAIAMSVKPRL